MTTSYQRIPLVYNYICLRNDQLGSITYSELRFILNRWWYQTILNYNLADTMTSFLQPQLNPHIRLPCITQGRFQLISSRDSVRYKCSTIKIWNFSNDRAHLIYTNSYNVLIFSNRLQSRCKLMNHVLGADITRASICHCIIRIPQNCSNGVKYHHLNVVLFNHIAKFWCQN